MSAIPAESYVSAFPLVGGTVPRDGLGLGEFLDTVYREPPSWFFHLQLTSCDGESRSEFPPYSSKRFRLLARRLGLGRLPGAPSAYVLKPLEFKFGEPLTKEYSPYTFAFPTSQIEGKSFGLSIALLLEAAATRRPLPHWFTSSGCLRDMKSRDLELDAVGGLNEKLAMAIGLDELYDSRPLIARLYDRPVTSGWLGPKENRTMPGRVKLLILSGDERDDWRPASREFAAEPIDHGTALELFAAADFDDLLGRIGKCVNNGLLVVHVPTVFDALWLLGYHRVHPYVSERISERGGPRFTAHRVVAGDPVHVTALQIEASRKAIQAHGSFHYNDRLRSILAECCQLLDCDAGDVAVVADERAPKLLRLDAITGTYSVNLAGYVPGDAGINAQVLRGRSMVVVEDISTNKDYRALVADNSPAKQLYRPEFWDRYREFLSHIHACVKFPLLVEGAPNGNALGVFCLHRSRTGPFDPHQLQIVSALVGDAAALVRDRLLAERSALEWTEKMNSRSEHLGRRTVPVPSIRGEQNASKSVACDGGASGHVSSNGHGSCHDGELELAKELAKVARELSKGFRSVVRLVSHNGTELYVAGLDERESGNWPADYSERRFPLDGPTAAAAAVRKRMPQFIAETALADRKGYEPICPEARSVAALPLRVGGTILGALSVDWDFSGRADYPLLNALEELAAQYAAAIRKWRTDAMFAEVQLLLADGGIATDIPDLPTMLREVAWALGAQRGSIFLRRRDTGNYHLAASLLHPDFSGDDRWYVAGEGLTGWVARYNRPLRLADIGNHAELAVFGPNPPVWKNKCWDGSNQDDLNQNYLGVPVGCGKDVFGVLRMSSRLEEIGFDSDDQAVAQVVGNQLGNWLAQREYALKRNALQGLRCALHTASTIEDVAQAAFAAIKGGLGCCEIEFRLVNCRRQLRRVALLGSGWRSDADLLNSGEGLAGRAFLSRMMQDYEDAESSQSALQLLHERCDATGSGVVIPLPTPAESARGTLHVHRPTSRSLLPCDVEFADDVAAHVALTVDRLM